jgi:hypothetical protein
MIRTTYMIERWYPCPTLDCGGVWAGWSAQSFTSYGVARVVFMRQRDAIPAQPMRLIELRDGVFSRVIVEAQR